MGFKMIKTEEICLCPNQELELPLELKVEERAAIHGIVKFPGERPAANAVVKLFAKKPNSCGTCDLIPVTFTFTDECGQFLFGVKSGVKYVIKVFWYIPECQMHDCKEPPKPYGG